MKTIKKTIIILAVMSLTIFEQWGCSARKIVQRQSSRSGELIAEERKTQHVQDESLLFENLNFQIDSSKEVYHIKIFPLDSIIYSLQGGFKGKASVIEIISAVEKQTRLNDYTKGSVNSYSDSTSSSVRDVKKVESSVFKEVKNRNRTGIFVFLVVLLTLGGLLWKFGFRKTTIF